LNQARVVVIGGGIIGCGVLYHLARLGWSDSVLVEKNELTAGATWHAAGNLTHYSGSTLLGRVQRETTEGFAALEAETGQAVGFHQAGSIRVATRPEQLIENRRNLAKARMAGVTMELIDRDRIREIHPFVALDGVLGGAWTPEDGHVDPSSVTQALAKGARARGAAIRTRTKVLDILRVGDGWRVETDGGAIRCEHVVNAAGMWAPEIAAMVGARLPFVIFMHQHMVTEEHPVLVAREREIPTIRDPFGGFNVRQEGRGLLFGVYEHTPVFWARDGIPPEFGQEVMTPELDRSTDFIEAAMRRVPLLAEVGVKAIYNAPTSRTPDHNPLLGPLPGLRDFHMAAGFAAGIMQSGLARYVAEWIVEGEPSIDLAALDVRRYAGHAGRAYTYATVGARHTFDFDIAWPHGEEDAGRPAKTSALYDRLAARGAVHGARGGWEVPLWFASPCTAARDEPAFGRANWWPHVGAECRAVAAGAGLLDLSSLATFEVAGPGAAAFLDRVCACRLPAVGGSTPAPLLAPSGGVAALLLLARLGDERFQLTGPPAREAHDFDCLWRHLPDAGGVRLENVTDRTGALLLAGPRSRDILLSLLGEAPTNGLGEAPTDGIREARVGYAPVRLLRVGSTGEVAWEIHHAMEYQIGLHDALAVAGADLGLVDFGLRAFESMRLEMGHPAWGLDLGARSSPVGTRLERYIDFAKPGFIGRDAVRGAREDGPSHRLACLRVETTEADPYPGDPVLDGGRIVALVGSAGHGHRTGHGIALARLPAALAAPGTALSVEILGEVLPATVVEAPLFCV
jgi:dimethylglycine dehydrogenase